MDLNELADTMALHDIRGDLEQLDRIGSQLGGAIQWLFGLTTGLYFPAGHSHPTRSAMLDLALRHHDRVAANPQTLAVGEARSRIRARQDITQGLEKADYFSDAETIGFYLRQATARGARSTDPVHDFFTALLPAAGYRGGNGRLMYQTRLSELSNDKDGIVQTFIEHCRALNVFYGVSGLSLLFNSYSSGSPERAYPLLQRFPGLLYEDITRFGLEIGQRTDTIRDVNWLTAIDDTLLDRLGGMARAREALGAEVILHPYDGGIVFQAGDRPVFGDMTKGDIPPAYRAVNAFLEPLRYDAWERPYLRVPYGTDAMAFTRWWTHRFDAETPPIPE